MSESKPETQARRVPNPHVHVAGIIALFAVFVVVAGWFWNSMEPAPPNGVEAGFGMPHGVMVAGAGVFLAALITRIRSMNPIDILEAVWDLLLGMLAAVGMVLKGIWDRFLGLIGWH